MVLHQHISTGNHQIIKNCITIILGVEALFRADVADLHARERLERLRVSHRHDEGVESMIFISDNELRKESSMSAMNSQVSNPPFS